MKELFKKYCEHLSVDEQNAKKNSFLEFRDKFQRKEIGFYEFIDKMHFKNKVLFEFSDFLKNTGISKIEINENNVIFTSRLKNIKIMFNGRDRRGVPFEFLSWGAFEQSEHELFDNLLEDNMTILDIGANIGWYSLLWGKSFLNSRIFAFEPIKENYKFLIANIVLNGLDNIETYNYGLSDKNEDLDFYFYPEGASLASTKNILGYDKAKKQKCKVMRLDSVMRGINIANLDLIKCDVEGAELKVILGGAQTIKQYLPIIVLELFHEWTRSFDYHPNEALKFLKEYGYEAFLPAHGRLELTDSYRGHEFDRQNYFFLHKGKHSQLINRLSSCQK